MPRKSTAECESLYFQVAEPMCSEDPRAFAKVQQPSSTKSFFKVKKHSINQVNSYFSLSQRKDSLASRNEASQRSSSSQKAGSTSVVSSTKVCRFHVPERSPRVDPDEPLVEDIEDGSLSDTVPADKLLSVLPVGCDLEE